MKKKIFGFLIIATLAFTLSGAVSAQSSPNCMDPPPHPDCVCRGGFWLCPAH